MISPRHGMRALACLVLCVLLPLAQADEGRAERGSEEPAGVRAKLRKPPQITTLVSETHPAVPDRVFFVESIVRVVGKGFGRIQDGGRVELRVASVAEPRKLEVLSWRDDEVRLRLPRAVDLGIDPVTAETLRNELSGERRFVAIAGHLSLVRDEHVVEPDAPMQIVVVAKDFDGDGHPRESDRDDFDPAVH